MSQVNPANNQPGRKGANSTVTVSMPRNRLMAEKYMDDEYLLNQLAGVNDNPPEDGLPLRKWLIREAHNAIAANPKHTEVTLKPKSDKSCRTHFCIQVPAE